MSDPNAPAVVTGPVTLVLDAEHEPAEGGADQLLGRGDPSAGLLLVGSVGRDPQGLSLSAGRGRSKR